MQLRAKYRSKQELAYQAIREAIVTGELKPNERLIISNIADELGISDIPVREALKRLQTEGYVTNSSNGMVVSSVSPEEFVDLLEIRVELEGLAIRRAASNIDEKGLRKLKEIFDEMEKAAELHDMSKFSSLDKEFHNTIYSYCGVDLLIKTISDAWTHSERGRAIFHIEPKRTAFSMKEHKEIIEALERRDAKTAEELLKKHKKCAFELFISKLRATMDSKEESSTDGDIEVAQ